MITLVFSPKQLLCTILHTTVQTLETTLVQNATAFSISKKIKCPQQSSPVQSGVNQSKIGPVFESFCYEFSWLSIILFPFPLTGNISWKA